MGLISSKCSMLDLLETLLAGTGSSITVRREGAERDARRGARRVPQDGRARGDSDQHQLRRRRVELHGRQSPHQHGSLVEFCGRVAGVRSPASSRVRKGRGYGCQTAQAKCQRDHGALRRAFLEAVSSRPVRRHW